MIFIIGWRGGGGMGKRGDGSSKGSSRGRGSRQQVIVGGGGGIYILGYHGK